MLPRVLVDVLLVLTLTLAIYGMEYALDIMKLPREQGGPAAPTKWLMIGHSMGGIGILNVSKNKPISVWQGTVPAFHQ